MSNSKTQQKILEEAVLHHQGGDLSKARALYSKVLKLNPNQADALNLLGIIAQQSGDLNHALALFDRAMTAAPGLANLPFNKANALREAGQLKQARAAYEAALAIEPNYADALLNLGALLQEIDETAVAIATFNTLLKIAPESAEAHYNIGKCRHVQGRLDEAQDALAKSIDLDPSFEKAYLALAGLFTDLNKPVSALEHIRMAINLRPNWSEAISLYGVLLAKSGDFQAAQEQCRKAIKLQPNHCFPYFQLGKVYLLANKHDLAREVFRTAFKQEDVDKNAYLALAGLVVETGQPWATLDYLNDALATFENISDSAPLLNNVGSTFLGLDLTAAAGVFFEAACTADPDLDSSRIALAKLQIRTGLLSDGWSNLNSVPDWKTPQRKDMPTLPVWKGEDLSSKQIIVHMDQGIGDQILYSTVIPELIEKAGSCIIECSKRLVPVLARSFPGAEVKDWLDNSALRRNRETSDYFTLGMHLCCYFRKSFDDFPRANPILRPKSALASEFRKRYEQQANGRRIVGLSWLSGSQHDGPFKTIDLKQALQRLNLDDVYLVSLQYGNVNMHLSDLAESSQIKVYVDPSVDQLTDLEPYLAQVAATDLVISISNTTAHVAGGLGVPTWLLLPRGAGVQYFWFMERENSPWYPSLRIFRQQTAPNFKDVWWQEVIDEVASAMQNWLSEPLTRPEDQ